MVAFSLFSASGMLRFSRRLPLLLTVSLLMHLLVLEWAGGNLHLSFPREEAPVMAIDLPPAVRDKTPAAVGSSPRRNTPPRPVHHAHRSAAPVTPATPPPSPETATATASAAPATPLPAQAAPADQAGTAEKPETPAAATAPADAAPSPKRYAVSPPPPAELWYDVQQIQPDGGSRSGHGSIAWRRNGNAYTVEGEVGVLFFTLLTFTSEGEIDDFGVSPVIYSEKRFRRSQTNTHFHRGRNLISFSASQNSYPRLGGEQDRASLMWQLAGIGRADKGVFTPGGEIELMVAGVRDAEPWVFVVAGKEDIKVGIGAMSAWHLTRKPRAGSYEQALDIWLAPGREWYPVKIKYTETNGSYLELALTDIQSK